MVRVTFLPDMKVGLVPKTSTILDAAHAAGVFISSSCGGEGVCGKCIVTVLEGDVFQESNQHLTDEQRNKGMVVACMTAVRSDAVIEIPPQDQLDSQGILKEDSDGGCVERRAMGLDGFDSFLELNPGVSKVLLNLPAPSLADHSDDVSRLKLALRKRGFEGSINIDLDLLKRIPAILRENEWRVVATMAADTQAWDLIDLAPSEGRIKNYGLAIDLGTTTIVVELLNLVHGTIMDCEGAYNGQVSYGDDVITRMIRSGQDENGLTVLHNSMLDTVNSLIETLCARRKIKPGAICSVVAAGNTVMSHFFLGVDPANIRKDPYVPGFTVLEPLRTHEAGLVVPGARLYLMPCVAGYIGGDITSGILASGLHESEKLTLFVDIGTNGEIVLGNGEWLTTCSCSAGPAFEGSGIEFGMRAATGAIESVHIDTESDSVRVEVVGKSKPRGICGTGMISAMGAMLRAGIINRSGDINAEVSTPRIRQGNDGLEYVLVWKRDTTRNDDIVLTEADIKNLIRSKGAVFAGISVLLKKMELTFDDIERFLIAGGFGNNLDIPQAVEIGLLPDIPRERFAFIGNSSLKGARRLLINEGLRAKVEKIAGKMTYIDLSSSHDFMHEYTAALFLPHTDLGLFPSITGEGK